MKRYNLVISKELYDAVEAIAQQRGTSVVAVMKQFIKIGLLADGIEGDPNMDLLVREDGVTRVLRLFDEESRGNT